MRIRKTLAAAALIGATATVTPLVTASASHAADGWRCYGWGTGSTHQEAVQAANADMVGNVTVGPWVYTGGQYSDGTYWEQISADCVLVQ